MRLLPWIIEADFEDRRPELSRRPGETEAMRLGMPGDCPRPGRTDELSRQRAAFIISTPGRKSKFRELKQQTDEAVCDGGAELNNEVESGERRKKKNTRWQLTKGVAKAVTPFVKGDLKNPYVKTLF